MATVLAEPRCPTECWQTKLEDWIAETNEIVQLAADWAAARGWQTLRDEKVITEDLIGTYEAPRLLIHRPEGRLLLDPVARYIVGAAGRFDFCVIPPYDSVPLVKMESGWRFSSVHPVELDLPWCEQSFAAVCDELVKHQ